MALFWLRACCTASLTLASIWDSNNATFLFISSCKARILSSCSALLFRWVLYELSPAQATFHGTMPMLWAHLGCSGFFNALVSSSFSLWGWNVLCGSSESGTKVEPNSLGFGSWFFSVRPRFLVIFARPEFYGNYLDFTLRTSRSTGAVSTGVLSGTLLNVLPPFQIVSRFSKSRCIIFSMHLNIVFI